MFVDENLTHCEQILEGPRGQVERLFFGRRTYLKKEGEEPALLPREEWTGGIQGDSMHRIDLYRTWAMAEKPAGRGEEKKEEGEEEGVQKPKVKLAQLAQLGGVSSSQSETAEMETEKERKYSVWGMSFKKTQAASSQVRGDRLAMSGSLWLTDATGVDSGWKKFPNREGWERFPTSKSVVSAGDVLVVEEDVRKTAKPAVPVRRKRMESWIEMMK